MGLRVTISVRVRVSVRVRIASRESHGEGRVRIHHTFDLDQLP